MFHDAPATREAHVPAGRRNPPQAKPSPAISVSYLRITSFVMQMQLPLGAGSEAQFIVKQIRAFITESRISQLKKILTDLKAEDKYLQENKRGQIHLWL